MRTTEPARPSNVVSADTQTQSGRQRSGVAQDRALELHQQNLANDSAATFGQFRAGEALVQLGRYAEALPHLRRAMELGNQDFVTDSLILFQRLSRAMIQSGMCKALAKLTRPDAATACARTARFVDATPVEPTHAFPRAHFAGLWLEIGEAYEALAQQARLAEAERDAHHLAARDSYRKSLDIWQDLTTRKLISPIDTTRFRVAALAVERTNGALGKP